MYIHHRLCFFSIFRRFCLCANITRRAKVIEFDGLIYKQAVAMVQTALVKGVVWLTNNYMIVHGQWWRWGGGCGVSIRPMHRGPQVWLLRKSVIASCPKSLAP